MSFNDSLNKQLEEQMRNQRQWEIDVKRMDAMFELHKEYHLKQKAKDEKQTSYHNGEINNKNPLNFLSYLNPIHLSCNIL